MQHRTCLLTKMAIDTLISIHFRIPKALNIIFKCYCVCGTYISASITSTTIDFIFYFNHFIYINFDKNINTNDSILSR